jgi:hypothetical protein
MSDTTYTIDTQQMGTIAKAIQADTDHLEQQTNTLMGQLDSVYLNFPPGASNLAQESQVSLNAIFRRIRTEDSRISQMLQAIADAVDQLEHMLEQEFTPH